MNGRLIIILLGWCCYGLSAQAQQGSDGRLNFTDTLQISGHIRFAADSTDAAGVDMVLSDLESGAQRWITTGQDGTYVFEGCRKGRYVLMAYQRSFQALQTELTLLDRSLQWDGYLQEWQKLLGDVIITAGESNFSARKMANIEGVLIYAGKKTEALDVAALTANKSANSARQVYAQIGGVHVWESDGSGLQLGIGGRGLSPNRTENFNTRQEGYDIAADALGYPESYYTPPVEALQRIEVVRGAASLQYGTQFGGLLNFVLQGPPQQEGYVLEQRSSFGTYGFLSCFQRLGFRRGNWSGTAFYQYRRADGWRDNSGFEQHTAYGKLQRQIGERQQFRLAYTHMQYLAQQPGGLTDAAFEEDPSASVRSRNWFRVRWNIFNLGYGYRFSPKARLDVNGFGLLASREALGETGPVNRADPYRERDLLADQFHNVGTEVRYLQRYRIGERANAFAAGVRLYGGQTDRSQGLADDGFGPSFIHLNPDALEGSAFTFPSRNLALFTENIFQITENLTLTPGLRFEHLFTGSEGFYRLRTTDLAGNTLLDTAIRENLDNTRNFLLAGAGLSYRWPRGLETYANCSQNYRAITFNDLRVINPNFQVDPGLRDERGFTVDLGLRGQHRDWLNLDVSLFLLGYRDRIGQILATDSLTLRTYRFRTNVSDARSIGLEAVLQWDWLRLLGQARVKYRLQSYLNLGLTDARYIRSEETAIRNKQVEMVPPVTLRSGLTGGIGGWDAALRFQYVHQHYSDATNATATPAATVGLIPSYVLLDLSMSYQWSLYRIETGVTNLTRSTYFTRRAEGYPGPGILPGDDIGAYLTFGVRLQPE